MTNALSAVEHTAWPVYVTVKACAEGEGAFRKTAWNENAVPSAEQISKEVEYTSALPTFRFSSGFEPRHPIGKAPSAEALASKAINTTSPLIVAGC